MTSADTKTDVKQQGIKELVAISKDIRELSCIL